MQDVSKADEEQAGNQPGTAFPAQDNFVLPKSRSTDKTDKHRWWLAGWQIQG